MFLPRHLLAGRRYRKTISTGLELSFRGPRCPGHSTQVGGQLRSRPPSWSWLGDVFTGIPFAALDFYEDLEDDNSKTFWQAHKHMHTTSRGRADGGRLANALESGSSAPPSCSAHIATSASPAEGQDAVRDPPGSAWFTETSVYVQVSAEGLFRRRRATGGLPRHGDTRSSACVARSRTTSLVPALERIVERAHQVQGIRVGGHTLTRVPTAYDKEHPRAELLKHRTLTCSRSFGAPAWPTKRPSGRRRRSSRPAEPSVRSSNGGRHQCPRRPRRPVSTPEYLVVALLVAGAVVAYLRYVSMLVKDINATPDAELQYLSRSGWIALCILMVPIGALIYLACGRRR